MRVASVSKAFTGATALALVRRGLLSLDATIGEVLPDLPAAWHAVTLRQLMNHTSGVPDFIANDAAQDAVRAAPTSPPGPRELLQFVEDRPLGFAPGSRYRYSNSDNIIVGLMVAAAAGTTFEAQFRTQVLTPLRLRGTSLPAGTRLRPPALRGYAPDPPGAPVDATAMLAAGWAWTAGGIVSTPADMNAFIRAYVSGRLSGPAVRAQQRRTRPASPSPRARASTAPPVGVPLCDPLRGGVGPHRQHPRVHAVRRGLARWTAVGDAERVVPDQRRATGVVHPLARRGGRAACAALAR